MPKLSQRPHYWKLPRVYIASSLLPLLAANSRSLFLVPFNYQSTAISFPFSQPLKTFDQCSMDLEPSWTDRQTDRPTDIMPCGWSLVASHNSCDWKWLEIFTLNGVVLSRSVVVGSVAALFWLGRYGITVCLTRSKLVLTTQQSPLCLHQKIPRKREKRLKLVVGPRGNGKSTAVLFVLRV